VIPDLADLKAAQSRTAAHLHRTPLWHSATLSGMLGCELYLKAELFQKTGSFKPRGMLNVLMQLGPAERAAGAVTVSAGNAAQGLAYAARVLGIQATVLMPAHANPRKAEATRGYGAKVVLHGTAMDCFDLAAKMARDDGTTLVHSFDDQRLMAGHASLGLEIAEALPDADLVVAGIGGGGLIGGLVMALRASGLATRIAGVEPVGAAAMTESLAAGRPVTLDHIDTIADGLAPPFVGDLNFPLVRDHVAQVVTVTDDQIRAAMVLLMERAKLFAEPPGAAGLAGLLAGEIPFSAGAKVVCVISGGNADLARFGDWFPAPG